MIARAFLAFAGSLAAWIAVVSMMRYTGQMSPNLIRIVKLAGAAAVGAVLPFVSELVAELGVAPVVASIVSAAVMALAHALPNKAA